MRLAAVAVCVLGLAVPAGASYILTPLSGGAGAATVNPGDAIDLDILLTTSAADEHTSAILRLVFSEPGLLYEGYTWAAPYANGTIDDDSKPLAGGLPLVLGADTLSGAGYPAGMVDVELSNVTDGGAGPPPPFGVGVLVTVTLRVPAGYQPAPGTITIGVAPDTLASGFGVIDAAAGPGFELTVTPEPATLALLLAGGLALAIRRR